MDIDIEKIENLKDNDDAVETAALPEKKVDDYGRAYATGKRKNAVARVWLKPGSGVIKINGKVSDDYFARPVLRMLINQPLVAAERVDQFDVTCSVTGGGLSGQAGAIRLGIARALLNANSEFRSILKDKGFLTRDSRKVERKKPGQPGARKRFQFSKR